MNKCWIVLDLFFPAGSVFAHDGADLTRRTFRKSL